MAGGSKKRIMSGKMIEKVPTAKGKTASTTAKKKSAAEAGKPKGTSAAKKTPSSKVKSVAGTPGTASTSKAPSPGGKVGKKTATPKTVEPAAPKKAAASQGRLAQPAPEKKSSAKKKAVPPPKKGGGSMAPVKKNAVKTTDPPQAKVGTRAPSPVPAKNKKPARGMVEKKAATPKTIEPAAPKKAPASKGRLAQPPPGTESLANKPAVSPPKKRASFLALPKENQGSRVQGNPAVPAAAKSKTKVPAAKPDAVPQAEDQVLENKGAAEVTSAPVMLGKQSSLGAEQPSRKKTFPSRSAEGDAVARGAEGGAASRKDTQEAGSRSGKGGGVAPKKGVARQGKPSAPVVKSGEEQAPEGRGTVGEQTPKDKPAGVESGVPDPAYQEMEREINAATSPILYSIHTSLKPNDIIVHKVFGRGKVVGIITPNKAEVVFRSGKKILVCVLRNVVILY